MKLAFEPEHRRAAMRIQCRCRIMALSRVPVSVAYPMLLIGHVVNAFVAYLAGSAKLAGQKPLASASSSSRWLVAKS